MIRRDQKETPEGRAVKIASDYDYQYAITLYSEVVALSDNLALWCY